MTLLLLVPALVCGGGKFIVGYYPDWNRTTYPQSRIPYHELTHIAHAFLIPNSDGTLGGTSGFAYPALVQGAHQAGVAVIVAVGGWGQSAGFSPMAADTSARRKFVQNIKDFCLANEYDGVDLDWEYPANTADRANLTLLVRELRQAFAPMQPPRSISMAVPAGNWSGQWFDFGSMKDDLDWLGIMTYDYFGSWTPTSGPNSPLYGTWSTNNQGWIDDSFRYYAVTRNIPPAKLLLGFPFYGQLFNAPAMYAPSSGASQKTHQTIAPLLSQGWTRYWDSEGQVPYLINPSGTQVVSYDDTASIRIKSAYGVGKGVQGCIVWAIGQDYLNGEQPLLSALASGFGLVSAVPPEIAGTIPSSIVLDQNYPNPFNPSTTIRYALPLRSHVTLSVFNTLGQKLCTIVDEVREAGYHDVLFVGSGFASGVYLYRLQVGAFVESKKFTLLR